MTRYRHGADLERAIVNYLKERGWEASRSAGSHGKFDVYAIKGNKILLLQVKREISKPKAQELYESFKPYQGPKFCFARVVTRDYKKELSDILLEN